MNATEGWQCVEGRPGGAGNFARRRRHFANTDGHLVKGARVRGGARSRGGGGR